MWGFWFTTNKRYTIAILPHILQVRTYKQDFLKSSNHVGVHCVRIRRLLKQSISFWKIEIFLWVQKLSRMVPDVYDSCNINCTQKKPKGLHVRHLLKRTMKLVLDWLIKSHSRQKMSLGSITIRLQIYIHFVKSNKILLQISRKRGKNPKVLKANDRKCQWVSTNQLTMGDK